MKSISVIICCYNSASRIRETLRHIALQEFSEQINCEVILVDNASSDNTSEIATLYWRELNNQQILFKVVDQPIPGLSNARKKGMETAQFDLFLFCDDDNWLFKDYIQLGVDLFQSMPEVGIIGGLPLPQLEIYPGKWIEQMYPAMAIGPRASSSQYIDWVFGAGMFVKKEVFTKMNQKGISFFLTDRVGKKPTSGGDSELCVLARLLGFKIFYAEELKLYHYMQKHRLRKKNFLKNMYIKIEAYYYLIVLDKNKTPSFDFIYMLFLIPKIILSKNRFTYLVQLWFKICFFFWMIININQRKLIHQHILLINFKLN